MTTDFPSAEGFIKQLENNCISPVVGPFADGVHLMEIAPGMGAQDSGVMRQACAALGIPQGDGPGQGLNTLLLQPRGPEPG